MSDMESGRRRRRRPHGSDADPRHPRRTPGARVVGRARAAGFARDRQGCRRTGRRRPDRRRRSPTIRCRPSPTPTACSTSPRRPSTVEFAGYAAQARIVHVIGTTGCSPDDEAKIAAAARHAAIVKSGNMSLGVNLLAVPGRAGGRGARPPRTSTSRSSKCITATRSTRRPAPRCCSARRRRRAATSRSPRTACASRDGHTGARKAGTIGFATLRGGSVVGDHSVILAGDGERIDAVPPRRDRAIFARGARPGGALGARQASPASTPCATCSGSA